MQVPFSQTLRALENQHANLTLITLLAALVLLIAWDLWFFLGRVPRYEIAPITQIEQGRDVWATVPAAYLDRIEYGQTALLNLEGQNELIPATVIDVDMTTQQVRLWVESQEIWLPAETTGWVEFAIAHTSPVTLLLRATGLSEPVSVQ